MGAESHAPIRVFAMLPLDTVDSEGVLMKGSSGWLKHAMSLLAASGVHGVAVDVWWCAVERAPKHYNWTGYQELLKLVKESGLKMQVVMSFHACGGNIGDTAHIGLPAWVLQCGREDPDLFYTDKPRGGLGHRNREYVSIWASDQRSLCGRTAYECYEDFMSAFCTTFASDLGTVIEEVVIGAGPCGELRYPSYPEANGWRFPGIGEFQCYDRHALASLAKAAVALGRPEWGRGGPHDSGHYNSTPEETGFFACDGSWDTPYGRFFLSWYSECLLKHGERLIHIATRVFGTAAKHSISLANGIEGKSTDGHPSVIASHGSGFTPSVHRQSSAHINGVKSPHSTASTTVYMPSSMHQPGPNHGASFMAHQPPAYAATSTQYPNGTQFELPAWSAASEKAPNKTGTHQLGMPSGGQHGQHDQSAGGRNSSCAGMHIVMQQANDHGSDDASADALSATDNVVDSTGTQPPSSSSCIQDLQGPNVAEEHAQHGVAASSGADAYGAHSSQFRGRQPLADPATVKCRKQSKSTGGLLQREPMSGTGRDVTDSDADDDDDTLVGLRVDCAAGLITMLSSAASHPQRRSRELESCVSQSSLPSQDAASQYPSLLGSSNSTNGLCSAGSQTLQDVQMAAVQGTVLAVAWQSHHPPVVQASSGSNSNINKRIMSLGTIQECILIGQSHGSDSGVASGVEETGNSAEPGSRMLPFTPRSPEPGRAVPGEGSTAAVERSTSGTQDVLVVQPSGPSGCSTSSGTSAHLPVPHASFAAASIAAGHKGSQWLQHSLTAMQVSSPTSAARTSSAPKVSICGTPSMTLISSSSTASSTSLRQSNGGTIGVSVSETAAMLLQPNSAGGFGSASIHHNATSISDQSPAVIEAAGAGSSPGSGSKQVETSDSFLNDVQPLHLPGSDVGSLQRRSMLEATQNPLMLYATHREASGIRNHRPMTNDTSVWKDTGVLLSPSIATPSTPMPAVEPGNTSSGLGNAAWLHTSTIHPALRSLHSLHLANASREPGANSQGGSTSSSACTGTGTAASTATATTSGGQTAVASSATQVLGQSMGQLSISSASVGTSLSELDELTRLRHSLDAARPAQDVCAATAYVPSVEISSPFSSAARTKATAVSSSLNLHAHSSSNNNLVVASRYSLDGTSHLPAALAMQHDRTTPKSARAQSLTLAHQGMFSTADMIPSVLTSSGQQPLFMSSSSPMTNTTTPNGACISNSTSQLLSTRPLLSPVMSPSTARTDLAAPKVTLSLKIPGVHWWFKSRSHAAELTAGYYNTASHDGYEAIVALCAKHDVSLTLTCVEMCDGQHPKSASCSPEGLLKQLRALTAKHGVPLSGENALPIFLPHGGIDTVALNRIVINTRAWYGPGTTAALVARRQQQQLRSVSGLSTDSGTMQYSQQDLVMPASATAAPVTVGSRPSTAAGFPPYGSSTLHAASCTGASGCSYYWEPAKYGSHGQNYTTGPIYDTHPVLPDPHKADAHGSNGSQQFHHAQSAMNSHEFTAQQHHHDPTCMGRSYSDTGRLLQYSHYNHQQHSYYPTSVYGTASAYGHRATTTSSGFGYMLPPSTMSLGHHSLTAAGGFRQHNTASPVTGTTVSQSSHQLRLGAEQMPPYVGCTRPSTVHSVDGSVSTAPAAAAGVGGYGGGALCGNSHSGSNEWVASARSTSGSTDLDGLAAPWGLPGEHHGITACGLRTDSYSNIREPLPAMRSFTFLRLGPELLLPGYQSPWLRFMAGMQQGGYATC